MSLARLLIYILLIPCIGLLSACGGDEGGLESTPQKLATPQLEVFYGSCDSTMSEAPTKNCREWYGDFFETKNLEITCTTIYQGAYDLEYCSDEALIGICEVPVDEFSYTKIFYYEKDWYLENAMTNCEGQDPKSKWIDI